MNKPNLGIEGFPGYSWGLGPKNIIKMIKP